MTEPMMSSSEGGVAQRPPTPEMIEEPARLGLGQILARGSLAAFVLSVLIHLCGWFVSGYVRVGFWEQGGRPVGPQGDTIEMAILTESEMLNVVGETTDAPGSLVPEAEEFSAGMAEVADTGPGSDLPGVTEGPSEIGDTGGSGTEVWIPGQGLGGAGGGGGGAKFFGVEATGSRFAYIVDVSGSMEGARLDALREELTHSISELPETAQFLVIPFASTALPLGDRTTWTEASPTGKKWAKNAIVAELARARDGTVPLPGFQIAFTVRPRPEAIYFMTDGEQFPENTQAELEALNGQFKVPVHCIRFGDKAEGDNRMSNDAEKVMRAIAKQSKGTYKFLAIK
jgi:hypothetical protein